MTINNALKEQINLKDEIHIFKESTKPKNRDQKEKQALTSENAKRLLRGRPNVPNGFESEIFLRKNRHNEKDVQVCQLTQKVSSDHTRIKILTYKQMPIVLVQVKAGKRSEYLQNKTHH